MRPISFLCAVIFTRKAICSSLSTLHGISSGRQAHGLALKTDDNLLCTIPRGHFDICPSKLHPNISSDQDSTCVWSDNHERQYCVFADPLFDHGKGISVITTPERARHLFNSSAFVSGHVNSTHEPLFRTSASGGKGRGIFANRHIPAGSLITQEPPIIFLDRNWVEDIRSDEAREALQVLAVEKLPVITRRAFHELYGAPNNDSSVQKIWTNSYGVGDGPTDDWPGLGNNSDLGMVAVHRNISRINHSCRANAAAQWDWDLRSHKLYAARDIAPGEEITMAYYDAIQTRRERQEYTKQHLGFECACALCKATKEFSDLSDDRINEILLLEQYLGNRQIAPSDPTAMADLLVSLYKEEGLYTQLGRAYAIAAREWNGAGHEYQARSWAYQSVKAGLVASSGTLIGEDVEDMQALLNGARRHWSWRYRIH